MISFGKFFNRDYDAEKAVEVTAESNQFPGIKFHRNNPAVPKLGPVSNAEHGVVNYRKKFHPWTTW